MMGARPGGGPKAAPVPPQSQFAGFDPPFFGCAEEIMHREAKQAQQWLSKLKYIYRHRVGYYGGG